MSLKSAFIELLDKLPERFRDGDSIVHGDNSYYIKYNVNHSGSMDLHVNNPRGTYLRTNGYQSLGTLALNLGMQVENHELTEAFAERKSAMLRHATEEYLTPWLAAAQQGSLRINITSEWVEFTEWGTPQTIARLANGTWLGDDWNKITQESASLLLENTVNRNADPRFTEPLYLPEMLNSPQPSSVKWT